MIQYLISGRLTFSIMGKRTSTTLCEFEEIAICKGI